MDIGTSGNGKTHYRRNILHGRDAFGGLRRVAAYRLGLSARGRIQARTGTTALRMEHKGRND